MLLKIGYIIRLADTTKKANIIYWFLIKCKKVIHSVLVTELYGMAHRFDIKVVIKVILRKILELAILLILCTNLES